MSIKKISFCIVALFMAVGSFSLSSYCDAGQSLPRYKSGEILVKFKQTIGSEKISVAAQALGMQSDDKQSVQHAFVSQYGKKVRDVSERLGVSQWRVLENQKMQTTLETLQQSPLVEYAEPNYIRRIVAPLSNGPNDTHYQDGSQWWIEAIEADRAFVANLIPQSHEVVVAIVDSGIRLDHEDLSAQLVAGTTTARGDYFYTPPDDGMDDNGHGTHVAGIVGAATNNMLGTAGTACGGSIKVMPIKALDSDGSGYDSDIASGIVWAVDHGANVLNLSFGSSVQGLTLKNAVDYAYEQGCTVMASAGNSAQEGNPIFYPAAYASVIAIAATTHTGAWADYSEVHDYVDFAAPGGHYLDGTSGQMLSTSYQSTSAYEYMFGTSMASPVAAGVAALLLAQTPTLTVDEVKNRMSTTATKTGSLLGDADGWNAELGWGQVNVYAALSMATNYTPKKSGRASYNFPNPFQPARGEKTEIVIPAEQNGASAKLSIFDAMGRLVYQKEISGSSVYPGATTKWSGRDQQGNWVANGVYFYRLDVSGEIYENKIAVLNQ